MNKSISSLSLRDIERFWRKVRKASTDDCWEWQAGRSTSHYGRFGTPWGMEQAHRVSWIIAHESIPNDMHVLHKCDNRICVNPGHLFLGTNLDNIADRIKKGRPGGGAGMAGEKNHKAKLKWNDVLQIRLEYARHKTPKKDLANKYGVSREAIRDILSGLHWKM